MTPEVSAIPSVLKAYPQWVVWRLEERNGRPTKVPYNVRTGRRASVSEPQTWCSFAEAIALRARFNGVGFVLTSDDPFAGVDLDYCRDPETGSLEPWAAAIVSRLRSYTEVTPSRKGIRLFVKATLPAGGRKRGGIEMYDRSRFLTVTGHHLEGTPVTVNERHVVLAALHRDVFGARRTVAAPTSTKTPVAIDDATLINRIRRSKASGLFERLWAGNVAGFASHSEADLALCGLLAFWTGRRPEQVDRLFRSSGLFRPKWDNRHYSDGRTYGEVTIAKAITNGGDVYAIGGRRRVSVIRVFVA